MKKQQLQSNILLLITAAIWGFAFVAQRVGAQYIGPFTFNGIRFALGGISLLPVLLLNNRHSDEKVKVTSDFRKVIFYGIVAGTVLFIGSTLQQAGMKYTTAGKAAFITGLYIALVPILGLFIKQKVGISTWGGVILAVIGLYFLSINDNFSIGKGDLLEIIGSIFWALHILVIDHFLKKADALKLSFVQILTCSILSLSAAFIFEDISFLGISQAIIPILYGGICSVGIAYTLQVVGQKHAKPSHAAIILSMESVFASLGGLIILKENLGARGYLGCLLMLSGMLLSQFNNIKRAKVQ